MEGRTGASAAWSELTPLQKKLIVVIACLGFVLICLICVIVTLVIQRQNKWVSCRTDDRKIPLKHELETPIRKDPKGKSQHLILDDDELLRAKKFIVSLHYKRNKNGNDNTYCVGSIVSRHWFLTSSLCLHQNIKMKNLYARAGSIFYNKGGSIHRLINFEIPDWRKGNQDYYTYRYVALAQVGKPFDIDDKLTPAVLPKQYSNDELFRPSYKLFTFGWGTYLSTEIKPRYEKLQMMKSQIYYASSVCSNYLQVDEIKALRLIENILCAGDLKVSKDQCNVDAGAPLTHMGIISGVSWSGTSCKNYPTVYSKVFLFVNWTSNYIHNYTV